MNGHQTTSGAQIERNPRQSPAIHASPQRAPGEQSSASRARNAASHAQAHPRIAPRRSPVRARLAPLQKRLRRTIFPSCGEVVRAVVRSGLVPNAVRALARVQAEKGPTARGLLLSRESDSELSERRHSWLLAQSDSPTFGRALPGCARPRSRGWQLRAGAAGTGSCPDSAGSSPDLRPRPPGRARPR